MPAIMGDCRVSRQGRGRLVRMPRMRMPFRADLWLSTGEGSPDVGDARFGQLLWAEDFSGHECQEQPLVFDEEVVELPDESGRAISSSSVSSWDDPTPTCGRSRRRIR